MAEDSDVNPQWVNARANRLSDILALKLSKQAMDSRADRQAVIRTQNMYRPEYQTGIDFSREYYQEVGLTGQASIDFKETKQALAFKEFCRFSLIVRMP